jgi:hypothetical protein
MNFVDFCFFTTVGDRGEWHKPLFFDAFPSAVLGELSSLCPRQGELRVCLWRAFCVLPSRRESLLVLDSWEEEDDDDDES